ncbi:hypothetical protein BDY17DRAFT_110877 [Neohortaea acidophila]|uniref:GAT domain-containing protein n=1 Tax=Neohortaea acidophila TaxID=245834 RepID=A0A6A6Q146_9PEZI|nr:uncharacterized protein BDY17DRAFT_110877 [Neohortaea acidophila]KAF2485741.1 hypothetical protein BDY17DRAFT_110877 [Neohortaea acidophila]
MSLPQAAGCSQPTTPPIPRHREQPSKLIAAPAVMASKMSKRLTGFLHRSKTTAGSNSQAESSHSIDDIDVDHAPTDSPEARVTRAIRLFCESGSTSNGGEEVLQLPEIVEAAESSPHAAKAASQQIRRFMGREWAVKPYVQYNSVMLIRILTDNPGPSFSRNFDKTFVETIKEVLRNCKDGSTQQILRETLDSLEANKSYQEGMEGLIQMWRKEKGHGASLSQQGGRGLQLHPQPQAPPNGWQYGQQQRAPRQEPRPRQLPSQVELASRIEEAKNTAKILLQLVQSTPPENLLNNDLVREFSDRCVNAQRSMQGYISADNPPPEDEVMLTLIETNEQLSLATSRYQRSLLNARKAMGVSPSPNADAVQNNPGGVAEPPPRKPVSDQTGFAAPPRSPPQARPDDSAFGYAGGAFQAPTASPTHRSSGPGAFSNAGATTNGAYVPAPPSPPTAMLARLNSRDGQTSPKPYEPEGASNPFADPVEHEANPAPAMYASNPNNTYPPSLPRQNQQSSQPFTVDFGAANGAKGHAQHPSLDDSNFYSATPVRTRFPPSSNSTTNVSPPSSPSSPQQLRPYQSGPPTVSYLGRQASAVDHLTMHGGNVSEIDGHSEVGRVPVAAEEPQEPAFGGLRRRETDGSEGGSAYNVTPTRTRA